MFDPAWFKKKKNVRFGFSGVIAWGRTSFISRRDRQRVLIDDT